MDIRCLVKYLSAEFRYVLGNNELVVILGARDDGDGQVGGEVFVVVNPVVGEGQKIVPFGVEVADDRFGGVGTVGAGGVVVEAALEQLCVAAEGLLANFHGVRSFLFDVAGGEKSKKRRKITDKW